MSRYAEIDAFVSEKMGEVTQGAAFARSLQVKTLDGMRKVASWMEAVNVPNPDLIGMGHLVWTEGGKPKVRLKIKVLGPEEILPQDPQEEQEPRPRHDRVLHVTLIDYHDLDDPSDDEAFVFTHALEQRVEITEALREVFS
jgi:hypothetical protein